MNSLLVPCVSKNRWEWSRKPKIGDVVFVNEISFDAPVAICVNVKSIRDTNLLSITYLWKHGVETANLAPHGISIYARRGDK